MARRLVSAIIAIATIALLAVSSCRPPQSTKLPDVEPWGDLASPYDDPIEVAAANALGPAPRDDQSTGSPFDPVRLTDFLMLDGSERQARSNLARRIAADALSWKRINDIDSLGAHIEALHIDPTCIPAFEEASRILRARGQAGRAKALALQGLRLDSTSMSLWGTLANIYLDEGDDGRARQVIEHALQLDSAHAPGMWEALAMIYVRTGQSTRADSLLQVAPKEVAASLGSYVAGIRARDSGDLETARAEFAAAAADSQAAVAVLVDLGNAEYSSGRLGPAEEAYRRALKSDPESMPAWNGLGVVQRARGDLNGAARSFAHVVARKPDNAAAQFNLAATSHEAALRAARTPRADSLYALSENAFAACIGLDFRADESRLRHAEVKLARGHPAEAYRQAQALMDDPKVGSAARLLAGRAAMAAGRPRDAVIVLAPAFQTDQLSIDGLELLGSAYSKLDKPADAVPVLRRAHERRPNDWQTAMNLGVALSLSGDLAGAESVLRPLAEAHPQEPAVLQNLAAVLQKRGRRAEADRLLQRVEALR